MSKLTALIALIFATACLDSYPSDDGCGRAPAGPGIVVAYEKIHGQERVLMNPSDYRLLVDYTIDVEAWALCTEHHGQVGSGGGQ